MEDRTRRSANLVSDNNIYVDIANDRVGIGTTIPSQKFDVNGNVRLRSNLYDSSNQVGTAGSVLTKSSSGVLWDREKGATVQNIIYVNKDGDDTNSGLQPGKAKATIKGAVAIAVPGDVIKVSAGTYIEDNPIEIPANVSIVGDSLREVTVTPLNADDLFYVSNGDYVAEMSFVGSASASAIFTFKPGGSEFISQSPYIQNCTNFISDSIGLKVDGDNATGNLKSMVLDSYTQYNQGGIGASITNNGYAQLVSLFTICNEIAVYCGSGGACDLTNSNSSFGDFGLVADNVSPIQYVGVVTSAAPENSNEFVLKFNAPTLNVTSAQYSNVTGIATIGVSTFHRFNVGMGVSIVGLAFTCTSGPGIVTYPSGSKGYVFNVKSIVSPTSFSVNVGTSTLPHTYTSGGTVKTNIVRPFDGQVIYFGSLYYTLLRINITNGGSGYTIAPDVLISSPSVSWGIDAQAVANITNQSVTSIDIVSSGRGFTSAPIITIGAPQSGIDTATASAEMFPSYSIIESATSISPSGICTITTKEVVPFSVGIGTTIPFFKQSRVLASGHSFEYIGSGVTISTALPSVGGVAIEDNQVDMRNGGLVIYTSTDQSGNFKIGDGVKIDQSTGQITGNDYSRSVISIVTPYILSLGGE